MTIALIPLPTNGQAAVRETLKVMLRLWRQARKEPRIRDCASDIIAELPGKCFHAEITYLYLFVRNSIRYQADIVDVETIQTPWETLARGYGDCDDQALLLASLLGSVGHRTRFKAVGFAPFELTHVYAQTLSGNNWLSVDTTEPQCVGWESPGIVNSLIIYNG